MIISIVRQSDVPRASDDDISNCDIHVLSSSIATDDLATYFATYDRMIDHLYDYIM